MTKTNVQPIPSNSQHLSLIHIYNILKGNSRIVCNDILNRKHIEVLPLIT